MRERSPQGRAANPVAVLVGALVAYLAVGNLVIVLASQVVRRTAAERRAAERGRRSKPDGVRKLRFVDDRVWRGAAPSPAGYRWLADNDVRVVVDLRAEPQAAVHQARAESMGLQVERIPLRDGQAPTPEQVARFVKVVDTAPGRVFVHCGAGVGRTGTMAAAWSAGSGQVSGLDAMRSNLAVGPPTLEQLVFAASMRRDETPRRVHPLVVAASRLLDAPRRTWHRLGL